MYGSVPADMSLGCQPGHEYQRVETIVPQQALFMMNSQSVLQQARRLAARSEVAQAEQVEDKVRCTSSCFNGPPRPGTAGRHGVRKKPAALADYRQTQYQRQTQAARERAKAYTKRYNRPRPRSSSTISPSP